MTEQACEIYQAFGLCPSSKLAAKSCENGGVRHDRPVHSTYKCRKARLYRGAPRRYGFWHGTYDSMQYTLLPRARDQQRSALQIRTMLSSSAFAQKEITFPDISTAALERVIEYFHYKVKHSGATGPVPPFEVPPDAALELLIAANYLDC